MKGKLHIYYDEEGDYLELSIGNYDKGYFNDVGNGVFERKDENTDEIIGFAVHDFKKRTKGLKEVNLNLPFNIELSS